MFVVVVTEKGGSKQRLEFDKDTVKVGRVHGNDVVLPRSNVSKSHALIEHRAEGFFLSDAGSTNGTYVNGRRVLEPQLLKPDDKVYVGDFILNLEASKEGEKPKPPQRPKAAGSAVKKHQKAPPTKRVSLPAPPMRAPSPTEKRIPLPGHTPPSAPAIEPSTPGARLSSVPPPAVSAAAHTPPVPRDGSPNLTDSVLVQAAKQLNLPELTHGPLSADAPTAATLRTFISDAVDKSAAGGRLPEGHLPRRVKGRIYRRAVQLGPLADWLNDPEIQKIRILSPTSIFLWKDGVWRPATEVYEGAAPLIDTAVRLSAGRVSLSADRSRTEQFYTEEGYLAHVSPAPESPFITVDKTAAADEAEVFGEGERAFLSDAVASKSKILVIGPNPAARRAVFLGILQLLPKDAFAAAVGDITAADMEGLRGAVLDISPVSEKSARAVRTAVHHARSMNPDWLAVAGLPNRGIPAVLSAGCGRTAVLAELPLGGAGILSRELAVSLTSCGLTVSPTHAAMFLTESFDLIVTVETTPDDRNRVKTIFATAVSERGSWNPTPLYNRETTR